jgi:hypothetical protein
VVDVEPDRERAGGAQNLNGAQEKLHLGWSRTAVVVGRTPAKGVQGSTWSTSAATQTRGRLTTETDTNSTGVEHGGTRGGVVVRSSEARQMRALACLQEKWSKRVRPRGR